MSDKYTDVVFIKVDVDELYVSLKKNYLNISDVYKRGHRGRDRIW